MLYSFLNKFLRTSNSRTTIQSAQFKLLLSNANHSYNSGINSNLRSSIPSKTNFIPNQYYSRHSKSKTDKFLSPPYKLFPFGNHNRNIQTIYNNHLQNLKNEYKRLLNHGSYYFNNSNFRRSTYNFLLLRAKSTLNSFSSTNFFQIRNSYQPFYQPRSNYSSWSSQISGDSVIWGLIIANGIVFVGWQIFDKRFMARHFTVSVDSVFSGRIHTIITSFFSHQNFSHLFSNMIGLYFFGSQIGYLYGGSYLLLLYCCGGIAGSFTYVAYNLLSSSNSRTTFYGYRMHSPPALGASGAVNSIVILYCLLFPTRIIYLNMFIPVPAILLGSFFVLNDFYGMNSKLSTVGHSAHLGGAAVGVIARLLKM